MRTIIQRCSYAKCSVSGTVTGAIDTGYLILVGFKEGDTIDSIKKMAKKIINLRIFEDENGKMNLNIIQVGGNILSISQFTLYANTNEGNRPSFIEAMNPEKAIEMYRLFNTELREYGVKVAEGIFGADMKIELLNNGPVTISLEF